MDGRPDSPRGLSAVTDAGARITPIDVYLGEPDDPCPTILKRFVHRATLVFDEAGTRTLRIRGRRERVGEDDETIELVRTIRVEAESGELHNRSSPGSA